MIHWQEDPALGWLCLTALAVLPELFFRRYRSLWVSVGAGAGAAAAVLSLPRWGQWIAFAVVCAALFLLCRRPVRAVRCADVAEEIQPKGSGKDDPVWDRGNVADLFQSGAGDALVSPDGTGGGLFP